MAAGLRERPRQPGARWGFRPGGDSKVVHGEKTGCSGGFSVNHQKGVSLQHALMNAAGVKSQNRSRPTKSVQGSELSSSEKL